MKKDYQVIEDAPVLVPNKEHKNFTESGEVIEKGTYVSGEPREISGLRRGEPFVYKMFVTENNKIIHLKKVKQMSYTEVSLGADAQKSATTVDLAKAEWSDKRKYIIAAVGGVLGFAYAKYKKHDLKGSAKFIAIGAVAGFGIGYFLEKRATVKKSK